MKYEPTWKQHEEKMYTGKSAEEERKATDAFLDERDKETEVSKKARDWESDRKEEWKKNKPAFAKKQLQEESKKDPSLQLIEEIRDGGTHNMDIKPSRGYVLIRLDENEETTDSGILIAEEGQTEPNTAEVVAVGDDLILDKNTIPTPVKVGAKVLFKKFSGMEIVIKGEPLRMIQFADILGEFV